MSKAARLLPLSMLAFGMVSAPVYAGAFDSFMSQTVGNKTTVNFSSNGTPVVSSSAPLGQPNINSFGVTSTAEGTFLESIGSTNVPGTNKTLPLNTKLKLATGIVAKGLFRAVGIYAGLNLAWEVGNDLYNLFLDYGFLNCNSGDKVCKQETYKFHYFKMIASTGPEGTSPQALCDTQKSQFLAWGYKVTGASVSGSVPVIPDDGQYHSLGDSLICRITHNYGQDSFSFDAKLLTSITSPSPITEADIAEKLYTKSSQSAASAVAKAFNLPQVQADVQPEIEALPSTEYQTKVAGASTVTIGDPIVQTITETDAQGNPIIKKVTTTTTATTYENTITYNTTTVTQVTNNTTGQTTTTQTSTVNNANPQAQSDQKFETCGLPGKPACKIDETGTATADPANPSQDAENSLSNVKNCLTNLTSCVPELPNLNWTFSLPSGCAPFPTPAFAPALTSIDVCQFQPIIHDIMSLLWAAAGLFGVVSLVFRDATGS